jgi:hypothetical protein
VTGSLRCVNGSLADANVAVARLALRPLDPASASWLFDSSVPGRIPVDHPGGVLP